MGLISGLLGILASATSRLIADDVKAWLPDVTRILIYRAIHKLPESARKDVAEEWQADLDRFPGQISKLIRAVLFLQGAGKIARELRPHLPRENSSGELVTEGNLLTLRKLASEFRETARRKDVLAQICHILIEHVNIAVQAGLPLNPELQKCLRKTEDVLLSAKNSSAIIAWDLARVAQHDQSRASSKEILDVLRNASFMTRKTSQEMKEAIATCNQFSDINNIIKVNSPKS